MSDEQVKNGPLQGIRVTEFTSAWAGPYATCLLGFLGAEVIKVESRARLDHSRVLSFSTNQEFTGPDSSSVFNTLNLNKRSVTLNLSKPGAIEVSRKLAGVSDVVMENMRPGVMPRLGLGYEVLKECKQDLIYLSSSACGQTGPEREYVGYAPTFAALGGVSHNTGYADWPPSNFMGAIDLRSATNAAFAILTALIYHQRTGKGQYIDLSSQEAIASLGGEGLIEYFMNGQSPVRKGNQDDRMAPHNCYRCKGEDSWVSIAVTNDNDWQAMCRVMGVSDLALDSRFTESQGRLNHQQEIDAIINNWTCEKDPQTITSLLQEEGIAAAPSLSSEGLFEDPHLRDRGVFTQVEHPVIGKDWVTQPPWKLSETPASIRAPAPLLGEDNDHVFGDLLGMSKDEISKLEQQQVIF
jgi:crotonobetainyl-CoA:carnitine CoA-transferase CaiB-like acyl-CoA transferase